MVDPLGALVQSPSADAYERAVVATCDYDNTDPTLTIDDDLPEIDRDIQSPVLGILVLGKALPAAKALYLPSGQMARAVPPDTAGEFQITGARDILVNVDVAELGFAIISYISKGTGHIH